MQEKLAKMVGRGGKEETETYITKSRRKNMISLSSYCYYYSVQKPFEFVGAVGRAILRCLRFDKTQTPARRGDGGGLDSGEVGGHPTSTADEPPISISASVTVMRSYDATFRSRKPPTPPVSSGKPPQIH